MNAWARYRLRYLSAGLAGVAGAFVAAFTFGLLVEPRTPWWGHLIFGLPAIPAIIGAVLTGRRYLHGTRS